MVENIDNQVKKDFFSIKGETRNCIAILHGDNQTEVLEKGPEVLEQEGQEFLEHFKKLLESVEVVAISGSLPAGLPVDYYASLVELANQAGKPVSWTAQVQHFRLFLNHPINQQSSNQIMKNCLSFLEEKFLRIWMN